MTQPEQEFAEYEYSKRQIAFGLITIFAVMLLLRLASSIGEPRIIPDLNYRFLILLIPAISGAISALVLGRLSDIFGRRALLLVSLGFILAGTVLGAGNIDFTLLIIARCIRAFGSGAIILLSYCVLADLLPLATRWQMDMLKPPFFGA